jgi:hypothetical protein
VHFGGQNPPSLIPCTTCFKKSQAPRHAHCPKGGGGKWRQQGLLVVQTGGNPPKLWVSNDVMGADSPAPTAVRFSSKKHQKQLMKLEEKLAAKAKQKTKRGFGRPLAETPPRQAVAPVATMADVEVDDLFPLTFYKKFKVRCLRLQEVVMQEGIPSE